MAIPDIRSYNGLLYSLGLLLEDVVRCRVTAQVDPDQFRSDDLKYGETNQLVHSEIWFEEVTGMGSNRNPFTVLANSPSTGEVTINTAYGASSPAVGLLFTIGNIGGAGFPHQQKFNAILMALADAGMFTRTSASATLDTTTYHHDIPTSLWTLQAVTYTNSSARPTVLPPSAWREGVNPYDRTLYLPYDLSAGQTITLYGRTIFAPPVVDTLDYSGQATNRPSDIVRAAAGWIRSGQIGRAEQANAAALVNLSMRRLRSTLGKNEIMLGEV